MTYTLARETIPLENYSALVAVGGDGTYHEVVNGMLMRDTPCKVPIAFIPNGSGNDTVRGLGIG